MARANSKIVLAFALTCGSVAVQAQVAVVVGAKSNVSSMTAEQVANLFLGKNDKLPGGGSAILFDQPESASPRELFYSKVAGKSNSQVKAIWSRLVFSGKGEAPKELANSIEVKRAVSANPNAIGYIEKSALDASVRVILSVE